MINDPDLSMNVGYAISDMIKTHVIAGTNVNGPAMREIAAVSTTLPIA
jgi:hypothetical protein